MPSENIAAVVLAAGRSSRMGQPKLILPWGTSTVIGKVIATLEQAGVGEILVVTGGAQAQVAALLEELPVRAVYNPGYAQDFMALSLQIGLRSLSENAGAALVALGDQPQIEVNVVRRVMQAFRERHALLAVPSYNMRRGHPWLVGRSLWPELLALQPPETTRTFLNTHAAQIEYVEVDTDSILRDLDTPEDYARELPTAAGKQEEEE